MFILQSPQVVPKSDLTADFQKRKMQEWMGLSGLRIFLLGSLRVHWALLELSLAFQDEHWVPLDFSGGYLLTGWMRESQGGPVVFCWSGEVGQKIFRGIV